MAAAVELSPWKGHTASASAKIYCHFNPSGSRREITHLTILSSIDPSPSSSSTCRKAPKNRCLEIRHGCDFSFTVSHDKGRIALGEELEEQVTVIRKDGNSIRLRKIRSIILLNVVTIVCASDIPVLKEVEGFMDPAGFCAVRFAISAIPFLPFVFRARNDAHSRNAGMELGLWVSLGYLVEALGLLTSDAGRASFISLFTVIVVPLLESMLGTMVPARTWFGILMSALGVVMLECSGSPPNVGDLLNFLSAIFFGIHMLRTEQISRSTKKEKFLPLLGYEVCVVALLSTIWFLIEGGFGRVKNYDEAGLWDWIVVFPWIPALYTGVFSTGFCLWAELAAMHDVTAKETAIIYGMEPLWGACFAWFLLGERWGIAGWIGAALILGGSITVQMLGPSPDKSEGIAQIPSKSDLMMVSNGRKLQKGLSASPVVVSSRNEVIDLLK